MLALLSACSSAAERTHDAGTQDAEPADPADLDGGSPAEDARSTAPDRTPSARDAAPIETEEDAGSGGSDAQPSPDAASRLLRAAGGELVLESGAPFTFRGAISCCGGGYGWPLADEAWLDYVAARSVTFLHFRVGPFLTGAGGEPDWAPYGGGYVESGGLADLERFNEVFWARVAALITFARDRDQWVEIDVADGWAIRHCRWGDTPGYSAWSPSGNLQGEDVCGDAGSGPIEPGSRHERWVRKVFEETGRFDNVIYQDGNELGLVDGYDAAWTRSMEQLLRDTEARLGYPRHLFGTNAGTSEAAELPGVDYVEHHGDEPADPASCAGKPCLVNEYNPDPPLSPETIRDHYCQARAQGTYFWYWRHGQDAQAMDESLSGIGAGCP